jgi:hypothetical protein
MRKNSLFRGESFRFYSFLFNACLFEGLFFKFLLKFEIFMLFSIPSLKNEKNALVKIRQCL